MATPEILSVREFRAGLTGVLKQVQKPRAGPVFVGAHRKAEAVVMSVEQYERLQAAAVRRAAVAEALASVRAEGLEPGPEALERFQAVAEGRMTPEEALEKALAPYRR
ncbi:hypothetical protein ACL02T_09725 [Pseudonocardia sp. RS010]|uniref:antitoxin VbhA family protein n=1 Tax=Pseudonocardia sp. RS010 TaxID=3385979 RepID=UPI0039A1E65B